MEFNKQHDFKEEHIEYTTNHDTSEEEESGGSLFVRIAVIIGILIILFFISLSIVRFVPKAISSIGSAGGFIGQLFNSKPKLAVTLDKKEVRSGDTVTVSWKNNTSDTEGSYTASFKCTEGSRIEYLSTNGKKPVICNTVFPLPENKSSYPFTVFSNKADSVALPITVSFLDKNTKEAKLSSTANISIVQKLTTTSPGASQSAAVNLYTDRADTNEDTNTDDSNLYSDATTTPSTTTSGQTTTSQTSTTIPRATNTGTNYQAPAYGNSPDISISLIQIGTLDSNSNFRAGAVANDSDRVMVRFKVANVGNAPTGTWNLSASLPTKILAERNYVSVTQPSLNPGASYDMTLVFDSFDPSLNTIIITLQSTRDVNSSNNVLRIPISYGGGSSTTGSGRPDLVVKILDIGVMDRYTNQIYYTNSFDTNDKIAVKFEVENIGGKASGNWTFEALLPTDEDNVFNSGRKTSINPGQKVQFTIGFDNPEEGSGRIKITVDEDDDIRETSERNNEDSRTIRVND